MHLFFTGDKRVGKSTLVNAIWEAFPGRVGGFRTVRLEGFLPGTHSVHLFQPGGSQIPGEENLLFLCGKPGQDIPSRFQALGCKALAQCSDADLILMDELGPHEASALAFHNAVREALEGEIPILGVLQKVDTPFLETIASHPRVLVLDVTKENRDALAARVPEWIDFLKR